MTTHLRLTGYVLLVAGLLFTGSYLRGVWLGYQENQKDEEFKAWYQKLGQQLETERQVNNGLRRQLQGRITNAKDPSFGCHLDADGVSIINTIPSEQKRH